MDTIQGLITMLNVAGELIEGQKQTIDRLVRENAALREENGTAQAEGV